MQPRLLIAGTNSGVGKTTITLGLMAAFQRQGLTVQGFKCGPDYIDPSYHTALTKRISRNLDSWMLSRPLVSDIFLEGSRGADLSLIEGVMGLYDGKSTLSDEGSSADISILLKTPVVLVVNISSMARSAAAIVKGYQALNQEVTITAVILNQAGSARHADMCKEAIEQECGIPVAGYLKKGDVPAIPERHLGLIPALERGEHDQLFTRLADVISAQVDLSLLKQQAEAAPLLERQTDFFQQTMPQPRVKIAVAYDSAFNFYYEENFTLLRQAGAELVFFSPLKYESLPENCDGLYLGGGFPEEFAKELAGHTGLKQAIKEAVSSGMPTLAECGGYMYLGESLTTTAGETFPMVGLIPMEVRMQARLAALGYREATLLEDSFLLKRGEHIRGHEFHYSTAAFSRPQKAAYETNGLRGSKQEGYQMKQLVAGYTHLHFASAPQLAPNWVEACAVYQKRRQKAGEEMGS
ncbi:cobyrinate a,c-diamide synthase [Halalkalibacter oceani]|uniref:cobyrinate a,c-diamide synthase n=1 Tax=Halalkalibacter oceani TaxID=1653776 RepID=UPI003396AC9E